MNPTLSMLEQEQLIQTIEMFELITQSNPDDYQSFDILKDAYTKIGRDDDALQVSRKLGQAYMNMGQYSSALLEFEGILQRDPTASDVNDMLKDVQGKMAQNPNAGSSQDTGLTAKVINGGTVTGSRTKAKTDPSLIEVKNTQRSESVVRRAEAAAEDGDVTFAKFLTYHGLCPDKAVKVALARVKEKNLDIKPGVLPVTLVEEVCQEAQIPIDQLYCDLLDKVKLAYVPLEIYDIDRSIVKMLPEELTIGKMILPFDLMSRTLMIALANPFDVATKSAAQKMLDYNIQWYVASPHAIARALTDAYKLTQNRH